MAEKETRPAAPQPPAPAAAFTRRSFLKTAAAAGAALATPGLLAAAAQAASGSATKRNLIFFLTDQERATMWFPEGWEAANMPGLMRLRSTGVSFSNACVNTAMCTPSRASIFTGTFPSQNGCVDTLTEGFAQTPYECQLNPNLPNLATILKEAGYEVFYKGKWHLSNGVHDANGEPIPDDLARYGFDGWNPPDAGQDTETDNYGGGTANHDQRFFDDAMAFLEDRIDNPDPNAPPFCLVISLVNPHDVLGYPGLGPHDDWNSGGYTVHDLEGDLGLPPTVDENLSANYKPTAQTGFLQLTQALGPLLSEFRQKRYVNFYANLIKQNDQKLVQLLDLLEKNETARDMRRNTWIVRTSDHGELGMSHQGLRQKSFQCYEEALRVPMIWSNTADFPEGTGVECPHLVSHVDFLPTVCTALLGVRNWKSLYRLPGVEYSALLKNPRATRGVQDFTIFTYVDIYAGSDIDVVGPEGAVEPPNRVDAIRSRQFKYARYYDGNGVAADQEEFYDLRTAAEGGTDVDPVTGNPVELINYSDWAQQQRVLKGDAPLVIPPLIAQQRAILKQRLTMEMKKLKPLDPGPVLPLNVTQKVVDVDGQSVLELFWYSQIMLNYQLQERVSGGEWVDKGDIIAGNNGPILTVVSDYNPTSEYRIQSFTA